MRNILTSKLINTTSHNRQTLTRKGTELIGKQNRTCLFSPLTEGEETGSERPIAIPEPQPGTSVAKNLPFFYSESIVTISLMAKDD